MRRSSSGVQQNKKQKINKNTEKVLTKVKKDEDKCKIC